MRMTKSCIDRSGRVKFIEVLQIIYIRTDTVKFSIIKMCDNVSYPRQVVDTACCNLMNDSKKY